MSPRRRRMPPRSTIITYSNDIVMAAEESAKLKALNLAVKQIEKQFGKGAIMRLGDEPVTQMETVPTGSLALDSALGVGGVPRGRVVEIYGPESSGKTRSEEHTSELQSRGHLVCRLLLEN